VIDTSSPSSSFAIRHFLFSVKLMTRQVVNHGTGRHIWVGPPDTAGVFLQGLFIGELGYIGVVFYNQALDHCLVLAAVQGEAIGENRRLCLGRHSSMLGT
jgi:hypothetical protein